MAYCLELLLPCSLEGWERGYSEIRVGVAPVDTAVLRSAKTLPRIDFEDAMQFAAARACAARHIVTRNLRDFRLSPIPAITPQEAVSDLR